jgi:hypothetical protein
MLTYLIQMIACSGVLYAYYHFFLRNEKFHQYNRFYLLSAMLLSLVLPLIKIPVHLAPDHNASSIIYAFAGTNETITVVSSSHNSHFSLVYFIYAIPVIIALIRLALSILHIVRIKNASSVDTSGTVRLMYTSHPDAPFSFFNWLFWNTNIDKDSVEGRYMLQHELYHIRSKHSFDLVFLELILAVCWFNPFFYLYRKEIKTIQEFLADKNASASSNAAAYAEILLLRAMGVKHQRVVNPFFHHQIKRRIFMLTSSKKPACAWLRKLAAVPLILLTAAVVIISCNVTEEKDATPSSTDRSMADVKNYEDTPAANDSQRSTPGFAASPRETSAPTAINKKREKNEAFEALSKVEIDAKYPGNWRSFLEKHLNGQVAVDNGAPVGIHTTIIQFIVDTKGNVSDVKALTNVGYGLEQESIRVIKQSGKWKPAMMNGKPVKAYRKQPITFQVTEA